MTLTSILLEARRMGGHTFPAADIAEVRAAVVTLQEEGHAVRLSEVFTATDALDRVEITHYRTCRQCGGGGA